MTTVNIHEAKTHLSRLVEKAAQGQPFVIAKAGKPMVRVTALASDPPLPAQRLGFLSGQMRVPANFDRWAQEDVAALLGGGSPP